MDIVSNLFELVKNNDYDKFYEIVKNIDPMTVDLNSKDMAGNYLINYTILNNNVKATEILIKNDVKIDIIDMDNRTLLYIPIKFGYNKILEMLVNSNIDNIGISLFEFADSNGNIPLNYCIQYNNVYALKLILDQTENYNIFNNEGYSPIHLAIINGNIEMCKIIFDKLTAFDIDIKAQITGETPIHIAVSNNNIEITELLMNYNPNINLQDYDNHYTPLHFSVLNNNLKIAKILLNNNADPNIQNIIGDVSLHLAIENDYMSILDLLLNNSETKNIINVNIPNLNNDLPLHLIFSKDVKIYEEYMEYFIKNSNLNYQNNNGVSIMHYLSITGEWEKYINILKIKKLDIFIKNKKNRSPVNLVTDNLDKYINMVASSYIYILRKKDNIWTTKWENMCKNHVVFNSMTEEQKKIFDNLDIENCNNNDACICIVTDKIKKMIDNDSNICNNTSFPNKKDMTCFIINHDYDINFCSFTGVVIDVLIGMIYLYKKYSEICVTIDKNIHENPELAKFYRKINVSTSMQFLNFEIVWAYDNLFFATNFDDKFKKCLESNKRFMIFPLGISIKLGNHANYLIYDHELKEIERFETYGNMPPLNFNYNHDKLDNLLEEKFKSLDPNIKYVRPIEFLPKISFQFFESAESEFKNIGDPGGFCAAWSIWYADQRISYKNINRKKLIKLMLNTIRTSNISFKNLIRNYSKNITDIRDKILSSANVTINDLINDQQTPEQINKITAEIYKYIE